VKEIFEEKRSAEFFNDINNLRKKIEERQDHYSSFAAFVSKSPQTSEEKIQNFLSLSEILENLCWEKEFLGGDFRK